MSALLALSLALQAAPALLPEAPGFGDAAGWRFERLDLPLGFAPDLGYEGFEEIRLGPGMFERDARSYFSYVLALRLEGSVEVDATMLEDFFTGYYRGLCKAVGEGRGLEVDLDAVQAEARRGGSGYVLRAELFDVFTDGAALVLHGDFAVSARAGSTEVLGLLSPAPRGAEVWADLYAVSAPWRSARPPLAFLNHVFFVVDQETYAALGASDFLGDGFAAHEERTTVRTDTRYTGRYFYGAHTYFEFLAADPAAGFPVGKTGIAFGFEEEGASASMAAALHEVGVERFPRDVTRGLAGEQLPWFEMLGIWVPASAGISLFSLEYEPSFLARWHPELPPARPGITRAEVLARYAAALETPPDTILGDVVELRLEVGARERANLLRVARAFGFRVQTRGGHLTLDASGYRLEVAESSDGGGRLLGFGATLVHPQEARSLSLGRLRVDVSGTRVDFDFEFD